MFEKVNKAFLTCATIDDMSPTFAGNITVLFCLARLEKASTYCSATCMQTAFSAFYGKKTGAVRELHTVTERLLHVTHTHDIVTERFLRVTRTRYAHTTHTHQPHTLHTHNTPHRHPIKTHTQEEPQQHRLRYH